MNTETDNEEVIHIEEDKNGGAIVSLPDSIPSPDRKSTRLNSSH